MESYDYDIFVIGGGSGGLAMSKEASVLGAKVGMANYVKPSPQGSKWGIGGTCVNVGCVPKKMMHIAAQMYENLEELHNIGYEVELKKSHNWQKLMEKVQLYIKRINLSYRVSLRDKEVHYINKLARVIDKHTVELKADDGSIELIKTKYIVIAVGGRPNYGGIKGGLEYGITSDDIFSMKKSPGRTLVIGASYIALECGGFLNALGYDVTIMVRSILLRGFDQKIAERIGTFMEAHGVRFQRHCIPIEITKNEETGKLICHYQKENEQESAKEEYDTVLFAIGRTADTKLLNLESVGVEINKNGKIIANEAEQTAVDNIYALGDCVEGRLELTPPAVTAGRLLSRRLVKGDTKLMDYNLIPTTVFTPIEYGSIGYSEEDALEKFGKDNIKVYHSEFVPLEWNFNMERDDTSYVKVVVNESDNRRVIGFHILAPNAGEITQGLAVAMKTGLTKDILDDTVGIHPTVAEEFCTLTTTTEEGDGKKTGC